MTNHIYIESIRLINFQGHDDTYLKFDKYNNLIEGESAIGKSSVRRAIEFCLFGDYDKSYRKTGTKKTTVIILLSNGYTIIREKSETINRYILQLFDKDIVFDAVGRSVPQEIQDAIGIKKIVINKEEVYLNSIPQITMPFLFDVPDTEKAKLFNLLTGNDILDDLLSSYNKDILGLGKDLKKEEENNTQLLQKIFDKEMEKSQIEAVYAKVQKLKESIKENFDIYSNLLEIIELNKKTDIDIKTVKKELKSYDFLETIDVTELTNIIDEYNTINSLVDALNLNDKEIKALESQLSTKDSILIDFDEINRFLKEHDTVENIFGDLIVLDKEINKIKKEIVASDNILVELEKQKKQFKICPACAGLGVLKNE